jgi:hypothetical protein
VLCLWVPSCPGQTERLRTSEKVLVVLGGQLPSALVRLGPVPVQVEVVLMPLTVSPPSLDHAFGPQHWDNPVEPGPPKPPRGPTIYQLANCRPPLSLLLLGPPRAGWQQRDGMGHTLRASPTWGSGQRRQAQVPLEAVDDWTTTVH